MRMLTQRMAAGNIDPEMGPSRGRNPCRVVPLGVGAPRGKYLATAHRIG